MALGVHLCCEVGHIGVGESAVGIVEQSHSFDRESEHRLGTLVVEPTHEAFLEPAEAFPVGFGAVGETELAEKAVEVGFVVVGNVPEDGLIVASSRRLVEGVNNLLEAVGNDLVESAFLQAQINHLGGILPIVFAVVEANEIVEIHQELWSGTSAAKHGADHEHHVDEAAAETFEVGGCRRVATNAGGAGEQPGVHRYAGAIICERSLVVLINKMVSQQVNISVGCLFAIEEFDAVGKETAVETDKVAFGKLADKGGNVFVLHVGVGVILATRRSVGGLDIVGEEFEFFHCLAVLGVLLTIEHEAFGDIVEALLHEGDLNLVLDLLDGNTVMDIEVGKYA